MVFRQIAARLLRDAAARQILQGAPQETEIKPGPWDLLCLHALRIESSGIRRRLQGTVHVRGAGWQAATGELANQRTLVVETGPGAEAARRVATALIRAHQPRWVISAGFAAGLSRRLRRGDLVIADRVQCQSGPAFQIDVRCQPTDRVHVGHLLSVPDVVTSPEEKRRLGDQYQAIAADMESYAVAEVCQREQRHLMCIRAVSDAVDDRLPAEVVHLLNQRTRPAQWGAALAAVGRRPQQVTQFWQLRAQANQAAERLGEFLEQVATAL